MQNVDSIDLISDENTKINMFSPCEDIQEDIEKIDCCISVVEQLGEK